MLPWLLSNQHLRMSVDSTAYCSRNLPFMLHWARGRSNMDMVTTDQDWKTAIRSGRTGPIYSEQRDELSQPSWVLTFTRVESRGKNLLLGWLNYQGNIWRVGSPLVVGLVLENFHCCGASLITLSARRKRTAAEWAWHPNS